MQSFGDETLLACLSIEKKNKTVRKHKRNTNSKEQNDNEFDNHSKHSLLFSQFESKSNNVNKSKLLRFCTTNIERSIQGNISNIGKYFEDSITFSKINGNDLSSMSNISKGHKGICSETNEQSDKTIEKNINVTDTDTKKKHSTDSTDIINNMEKYDVYSLQQNSNKSKDNMQNGTNESDISSSIISNTSDKESSNVILSPALLCTQDRCKLASWGLPSNILQKYTAHGVLDMFEWQVECLSNNKVLQEKRNLVYSAPTSAGKTLVAEILLIKTVLERRKKVIFILPFVSVVREKMYYFQNLLSDSGIRVEGFMGGAVPPGGFTATDVAIATIEKANSLVNRLMEENDLHSLGAVIIDELHLLGDANRGYLLELLLTKLKYMTIRNNNINIQLIGMSATLPNLALLAQWLNAELYKTEFRPIPLNEYYKIGANIYDNKLQLARKLITSLELESDVDNILQLCIETISDGHSVLIFCSTKKWCEKLAEQMAAAFYKLGSGNTILGEMLKKQIDPTLIRETLEQLKRSPSGLDNILKNTISFGVAFHHAGLTMDERDIIEGSFRTGSLKVLIATSTLSSGVNLPARRVIIRSPLFGGNPLNTLTYKQMIGRAGRMGKDSAGESILICKPNERNTAVSLLCATLDPIESCLNDFTLLIRALLEGVASEVLYTLEDLELYINCTLLSLGEQADIQTFSNEAIKFLINNELLLLQTTEQESRWIATSLGKACLAASIPPREGLFLFEELQKARRCFVLDTELHVIYLVTPLSSGSQIATIDWMTFNELWNTMSESERRVGRLVGVEERFIISAIKGTIKSEKLVNIHKRFYSALALHDLVKEVPLNTVCKKYGCCRGVLQALQQSAATYAGMVTQFCKQLRWDCMELLLNQFQTRLQFGVCRELLDLLRLSTLNGLRARSLYKQGITCVADLAVANELNVERALYNALPFESEKEYEGEYAFEAEKRNKMRTVFVTGKDGLTPQEAAIILVQEARMLVQKELGLEQLPWKQQDQSLEESACVESNRDMLDIKEQSQTELDEKNTQKTPPMRIITTAIGNTSCVKTTLNESQKNDNMYLDTSKKGHNINTTKKEKIKASKNQHLNQIALSSNQTKNNIDPLDFLDINSSDIITVNKELNYSKKNKQCSEIINNIKIKESIENLEKYDINIIDTSNKKLKVANSNKCINDNLIQKNMNLCITDTFVKSLDSTSVSLFDESLNLDTQICNILEQNIVNISQLSELEDSKASASELAANTLQKQSANQNDCNLHVSNKNNVENAPTNMPNSQLESRILSWDDDSWNDTKHLLEKPIEINKHNTRKITNKHKIINVVNTNTSVAPKKIKTCTQNNEKKSLNFKKLTTTAETKESEKPKIPKITAVQSPVANIVVFKNERRMSYELNQCDNDDIIITSQCFESPFNTRNRTRINLEKIRKMRSQKISRNTIEEINNTNPCIKETSNNTTENKEKQEIKSKLGEILAGDALVSANCSTDSVISNSENETANDSLLSIFKLKTQSNISNKHTKLRNAVLAQFDDKTDPLNETTDWETLNIIKVGDNKITFNQFKREVLKKRLIALALHCDMFISNENNIGSKICTSDSEKKRKTKKAKNYAYVNTEIRGVAISWEKNIAYYVSFHNAQESKVSGKEQMALVKELLSNTNLYMKCFATKDIYKLLYQCCGISAKCKFLDPIVAHWLYTNNSERNFNKMVTQYFPLGNFIKKQTNSCYNTGPGMDVQSSLSGEFRSAVEAVFTWHMTDNIINKLKEINPLLLHTFKEIEMKIIIILACMELSGIGINPKALQGLSSTILNKMQSLETQAYELAGKKFNLLSSKEVSQVLGLYKDKKTSTSKTVLEKCDNPISNLVILWRKLNAARSKMIYPLLHSIQQNSRIHGNCITCTVTGRISMHEPNLQNVPKDFSFEDNNFIVSVRTAFIPALGNIILSADYCQLELRLLTHFSQDLILCEIMKQPGDIFKTIAAKWNTITEEQVTNEMRQRVKQLCYGMIYGMGVKALAENLCISEPEAQEFLESFMSAYPGIYKWLNDVLEEAHRNGYVTTLLGRRRQLPDLRSIKSFTRAQAERQAVNTKVQGSAADIVKKAMINIEEKIRYTFPESSIMFPEMHTSRKLRSSSRESQQRGGYLILQLHDELLYEINLTDLKEVAAIIKHTMENVCQFTVPLPVKIRVGPAWGDLTDYQF